MDAVTLARVDAHGKSTRDVNEELRALIAGGQREIEVLHPGSRHNLAVGILEPARIVFRGDVGYFCGGEIADLGSDTVLEEPNEEERSWLTETLEPFSLGPKGEWRKVRSGGKLWRYDKKEFAVWKEAL